MTITWFLAGKWTESVWSPIRFNGHQDVTWIQLEPNWILRPKGWTAWENTPVDVGKLQVTLGMWLVQILCDFSWSENYHFGINMDSFWQLLCWKSQYFFSGFDSAYKCKLWQRLTVDDRLGTQKGPQGRTTNLRLQHQHPYVMFFFPTIKTSKFWQNMDRDRVWDSKKASEVS